MSLVPLVQDFYYGIPDIFYTGYLKKENMDCNRIICLDGFVACGSDIWHGNRIFQILPEKEDYKKIYSTTLISLLITFPCL